MVCRRPRRRASACRRPQERLTGKPLSDQRSGFPVVLVKEVMPSSTSFVVISTVDVKEWIEKVPSVDRLRPDRCPCCGGASRPVGQNLRVWGHGVRRRLFVGVFLLAMPAQAVTIEVRRFLCRYPDCERTFTVLPRQACPHRRYLLSTIVLALALWAVAKDRTTRIRQRLSPDELLDHHIPWSSWPQLLRWAEAGDLTVDGLEDDLDRHRRAERIALSYAGRSPPETRGRPLAQRAFIGAGGHIR